MFIIFAENYFRTMSPRPKRFRRMYQPPTIKGFRPFGNPAVLKDSVKLLFEEYEAIKLADYDFLSHEQAAEKMNVSRPTFSRIYDKARKKIAQAFIETRSIIIEGGNVQFDEEWFRCISCESTFKIPKKGISVTECPVCKSKEIIHINTTIKRETEVVNPLKQNKQRMGDTGFCICPVCEIKITHQAGMPCRRVICPDCGTNMIREVSNKKRNN